MASNLLSNSSMHLIKSAFLNYNLTLNTNSSVDALDEVFSIFHTSVPNIKLYYPEPFIATPTFVHDDIWFIHIVIYQYWLWFGFTYMIIFFFLAFLITVRWCNIRHRPVRETRGVSRSKCGDLITATVPVSWAASIIIHESTDAIEFSDGFGTSEMAIGIRAYQWGWEYYYPKDMDLKFYNTKSLLIGNTSYNFLANSNTSTNNQFKSNLLTSDISNPSNLSATLLFLKDLDSTSSNYLLSDVTLSSNKLIARTATSLITSKKLLNLNNFFKSQLNMNILPFYWLNIWEDSISSKPDFLKHPFIFLNFKDIYYFNTIYSNLNDKTIYFNKKLINFSQNENISEINLINLYNTVDLINKNIKLSDIQKNFNLNIYKIKNTFKSILIINNSSLYPFHWFADQDFKRWSTHEILEDLKWNTTIINQKFTTNFNYFFNIDNLLINNFNLFINLNYININLYNNIFEFRDLILNDWLNRSLLNSFVQLKYKNLNSQNIFNISNYYNILSQLDLFTLFSNTGDLLFFKKMEFNFINFIRTNENLLINENLLVLNSRDLTPIFKNFITYYQAFWKVYKSTLDEERSTFNYFNFSNIDFALPLVMTKPTPLLSILQKTQSEFTTYAPSIFIKQITNNNNFLLNTLSNYNSFIFPFMLSFESDIIRYSWFDWYSLRSLIIAKSADTSVFNLNAAKQYEFSFTKDPKIEFINKFDNYFTNYSFARKNFLPDFTFNPVFYNKFRELNHWELFFKKKNFISNIYNFYFFVNLIKIQNVLPINLIASSIKPLYLNYSTQLYNNHNFFNTYKIISNKFNLLQLFIDINSKKTYLLKNYNNKIDLLNISKNTNNLWLELKSLTSLNDNQSNNLLNLLTNDYKFTKTSVLKSQYVPLKKGIVNMIRIQADKAIAMPTDTRLQILAVSKDIIHSWSIPSAGIKIDCIPGYSSHRIAMFTVSGIYWGQCMEICGRFHHWMPIVVYFLRRDLFCLWCTHFIFNSKQVNTLYQGVDLQSQDSNLNLFNEYSLWNYKL